MVTGDHKKTAARVAVQVGILTQGEADEEHTIMTGEDFRKAIGPYEREWDPEDG